MRKIKRQMTIPQLKQSMDRRFAKVDKRFESLERTVIEEGEKTRQHFDAVWDAYDKRFSQLLDILRHHAVVLVEHESRIGDLESQR